MIELFFKLCLNCIKYNIVYIVIASAAVLCILMLLKYILNGKVAKTDYAGILALSLSLGVILALTLSNRSIGKTFDENYFNFKPFWSYRQYFETNRIEFLFSDVQNFLLFIPFGLSVSSMFKDKGKYRLVISVGISFALSVCIELMQGFFHLGLCEFDDIFHNTIGSIFGCAVYSLIFLCIKCIRKKSEMKQKN